MKRIALASVVACFLGFGSADLRAADDLEPGLVGEYFASETAIEDFPTIEAGRIPTLKRVDKQIAVDSVDAEWPGTALADQIFIRWTGTLRIAKAGKYKFFTESDDGSRLFVNDKEVVANGGLHGMEEKEGEIELTAGDHALKVEFFENNGGMGCKVSWQPDGGGKELLPESVLFHKKGDEIKPAIKPQREYKAEELEPGIVGEYFDMGEAIENFPTLAADKKPSLKRVDKEVNFPQVDEEFYDTKISEHLFARWIGVIQIPKDATYTFITESDDGSRLFIDGVPVVSNGGTHAMQEASGKIELKAGYHDIRIDYFENEGGAGCIALWEADGMPKDRIPASALFHEKGKEK